MSGGWVDEDRGQTRDEAIDLARLFRAIARRKYWIIIPTAIAFLLSLAVVSVIPPRYTGVAKVLLENQESYYTKPDKAAAEQAPMLDPEAIQSEAEAITSPDLARKAIVKLDLANRPEFNQSAAPGPLQALLSLVGLARPPSTRAVEDRLVDAFLARLVAFPIVKTRVIQIEFVSQDPEFAARGANVVAQLFLDSKEDAKKNEAKTASAWLAAKIGELRGKVAEADAKVEAFRAQSGLLETSPNTTTSGQQLSDINTQLAAARSAQAAAQARAQLLRSLARQGKLPDDPDLARDDSLRRLAEQRITLKAQIALEARTLLPAHPRMKELAAQLAELESQIRLAADKAARALENDARLAGDQVETLTATLAAQSKTVATGNADEVQLRALQLDANAARDQLESYVQKYREAVARDADNAAPADARIIAPASEPRTPTFPKKIETLVLGTLAGLLLSAGVVVSRALLSADEDAPIVGRRREEDVEVAPVLTRPEPEPAPPASGETQHQRVDAAMDAGPPGDERFSIDALAAHMEQGAAADEARFTLIAGVGAGPAQSIALELARALSRKGRAALIDLGAPQPWFADILRRDGERGPDLVGLSELIDGSATFEEALYRDSASRLDIIPVGASVVTDDGLEEVLAALAQAYDFVVAHASDWRGGAARVVAELMREVIVVAPGKRLAAELEAAHAALGVSVEVLGYAAEGQRSRLERAA